MAQFLVLLFVLFTQAVATAKKEYSIAIQLKPTGELDSATLQRGKTVCTFEWNVVGGTDEEWVMQITPDAAKRTYVCEIERPEQKSYLYFQSFKATLSRLGEAQLFDSDRNALKQDEHFDLSEESVTNRKSGFAGSLRELRLETKPFPKREKNDL